MAPSTPSSACPTSQSARTTSGDLPPSSSSTRVTLSEAARMTRCPVATEPGKVMWPMPGCATSAPPPPPHPGASAGHAVERARGQAGGAGQFGQQQRRQGGLLCGFGNHGATGGQCRSDAARGGADRVIPRDDLRRNADRLLDGKADVVLAERKAVPLHLVYRARVILEGTYHAAHIALGLAKPLAAIQALDERQPVGMSAHLLRNGPEHAAALGGRGLAPGRQGALCSVHGRIDLGLAAGGKLRKDTATAGVEALQRSAGRASLISAVDELRARQAAECAGVAKFGDQCVEGGVHACTSLTA